MISLARIVRILTDTRTHEAWERIPRQIRETVYYVSSPD